MPKRKIAWVGHDREILDNHAFWFILSNFDLCMGMAFFFFCISYRVLYGICRRTISISESGLAMGKKKDTSLFSTSFSFFLLSRSSLFVYLECRYAGCLGDSYLSHISHWEQSEKEKGVEAVCCLQKDLRPSVIAQ